MNGNFDVTGWLTDIGLGQYADRFVEHDIDFSDLPELTDFDLAELGVSIGHRKKFRRAINQLHTRAAGGLASDTVQEGSGLHDAERRQITVLFADLVDSTEWAARLDPEDMREIIHAYQAACGREIARFDGFIALYAGDGILAYFGYPTSHENDPELCVRAALGIVDTMDELNDWIKPTHHRPLAVRVGIATGVVVVGDLVGQGTAEQRSVVGETPNLAARLQSVAVPDSVVVSTSTRELLGRLFDIRSLGKHRLKGIADEVEAWQITGTATAESRFDASHISDLSPFVGRDSEMNTLNALWEKAKNGCSVATLLAAEPGVGKSRIIQEFRRQLQGKHQNCLLMQCWSHTVNSALFPITEMIHRALRISQDDDDDARLQKLEASLAEIGLRDARVIQLLSDLLGIDGNHRFPVLRLSEDARKRETLVSLANVFRELAASKPTILIIEDVHWIDPSTREFISLLWPLMAERRFMMLASIRSGHPERWPLIEETELIELSPISHAQAQALVRTIAGPATLTEALVDGISRRADGVPLFVEELTKLVIASDNGGMVKEAVIPASLHDLLLARLAQFGSEREVAMLCSVMGRRFDKSLVESIWRGEASILEEGLARLVAAGILDQHKSGSNTLYTFRHVLIQEAAYSSLLRADRLPLHGSIASVMEQRYADGVPLQPEVLADHFEKSGNAGKAVEYLHVAGQNCSRRSANLEALSHLNRGLELVAELPDSAQKFQLELGLLIAVSSPLVRTRGYAAPEAEQTLVRARKLCSKLGDSPQLTAVLCGLSIFSQARGDLGQARELAEQARTLSEKADDDTLRLLTNRSLGGAAFWQGDLDFARHYLEQGAKLYDPESHGALAYVYFVDPGVVCHSTLALTLWTLGSPMQAMAEALASVKIAEAVYHPYSVGFAKLYLATLNQIRLEARQARDYAQEVVELSEAQILPQGIAWGSVILGWSRCRLGEHEAGKGMILQGIELWKKIGTRLILPYFHSLLGDACLESADYDAGLEAIDNALDTACDTGEHCWRAEFFRLRGELKKAKFIDQDQGNEALLSGAESDFRQALTDAGQRGAKSLELRSACSLAQMLQFKERRPDAEALLSGHFRQWDDSVDSVDINQAKELLNSL